MELKNNFVSTVTIGRFNPAILTQDFLEKVCSINLGEGRFGIPVELPFPREILFDEHKLTFFVDLDRFQIRESDIQNIDDCAGPNYTRIYLEKLPYTPVSTAGINFNLSLTLTRDEERKEFSRLLNNESELFGKFKTNEFELKAEKLFFKDRPPHNKVWILTFPIGENLSSSIRVLMQQHENVVEINHNIQIMGLNKRPENIGFITEKHEENVAHHRSVMETLLKGLKNV